MPLPGEDEQEILYILRIGATVLQPLKIFFGTQHHILSLTQRLLEESCFRFAKKWFPSKLEKHHRDSAAACELTKWLRIVRKHSKHISDTCISMKDRAVLKGMAPTITQLRHTTVHRAHLTSHAFLDQIRSACILAEVLGDAEAVAKLKSIYIQVDTHVKMMEHDMHATQERAKRALDQIQKQREALVQKERELRSYVMQQGRDIPAATGHTLEESIKALLTGNDRRIREMNQSIAGYDEQTYGVVIEDGDIESDEDRLQSEL